ncbi:MAG: ABC transporter ATP-binding protein [Rikenellaceae bacterium]
MSLLESFKCLWRLASLVWRRIILCSILGGGSVICALGFVWLSKQLVDAATGHIDTDPTKLIIPYIAVIVANISLSAGVSYLKGVTLIRFRAILRQRLFFYVMESRWIDEKKALHSADMTNRLDDDVRVAGESLCNNLPSIIVTSFQFITAFIFLLMLQPKLAWLLVIIMPTAIVVSKLFFTKMRMMTRNIRENDSRIQAYIQESIENRSTLTAFGQSKFINDMFLSLQRKLVDAECKKNNITSFSKITLNLGFMAGYITAFLWGIFGLQSGSITFGLMTAFIQLVNQIQNPIIELSQQLPTLISSLASAERVDEILNLPQQEQGEQITVEGAVGISIENISFRYDKRDIFRGFSHKFKPNTITAITGETGAGKSTLIKLILSLRSPQSGSIKLYNNSNEEFPISPLLRTNIRYVPQGNTLISGTIRRNLLLGNPEASDDQIKWALNTACCDFVESIDFECQERGMGLSEGQAQRISIARALLGTGSILLFDEPTSSLDPETERRFMQQLRSEVTDKTIIIITHRQTPIEECDEVLNIVRPQV